MIERSKNEELSELERWIGQIEKEGVKKERRKSEQEGVNRVIKQKGTEQKEGVNRVTKNEWKELERSCDQRVEKRK